MNSSGSEMGQGFAQAAKNRGRVAVVDDDEAMLGSLKRILSFHSFEVTPFNTADAILDFMRTTPDAFDAILTDLNMPGMDGLELMRLIKEIDPESVIIVLTGFPSADNAIAALRGGAFDFLEKPYSNEVLSLTIDRAVEMRKLHYSLKNYHLNLESMLDDRSKELRGALVKLNEAYMQTMAVIVALLELKEPDTAKHSMRVSKRALFLAGKMGLRDPRLLESIRRGGLLHDIGKVGVPDSILNKPERLDEEEMKSMRMHPKMGYDIVNTIPDMQEAAEIILSHHERFDGKGYPRRLAGKEICVGARIFSIIDSYDAIRFDRCYRKGSSRDESLSEIERGSGSQFDPEIVAVFKSNIAEIDKL